MSKKRPRQCCIYTRLGILHTFGVGFAYYI